MHRGIGFVQSFSAKNAVVQVLLPIKSYRRSVTALPTFNTHRRKEVCKSTNVSLPYRGLVSMSQTLPGYKMSLGRLLLPNEESTYKLGFLLGTDVRPSDVLQLYGQLGAGKTSFARGYIHSATNDNMLQVTSPTYLLTNTYSSSEFIHGRHLVIYHMDLWRLKDASSRPIVDFHDVFCNNVSLIEWPDRLKSLQPSNRLDVIIECPTPEAQPNADDDPWGFGSGEVDDDGAQLQSSRYVRLIGHGNSWTERVERFYNENVEKDENGNQVLKSTIC